jgi:guanylate kinase
MKPLIVTITGPSSSGKTVLSHDLHDRGFKALISTTTRPMRAGEADGMAYHFVSKEAFQQLEQDNALIESIFYNGNNYGISRHEAEEAFAQGKPAALVVEPHGVEQVTRYCHEQGWEVLRVFVYNPTHVLMDRMLHRVLQDVQSVPGVPDIAPASVTQTVDTFLPQLARLAPAEAEQGVTPLVTQAVAKVLGETTISETAQAAVDKVVATHSSRMGNVLGFEQQEWVAPAVSGKAAYDLIFSAFNETNREAIVQQVREAADRITQDEALDSAQRPRRTRRVS